MKKLKVRWSADDSSIKSFKELDAPQVLEEKITEFRVGYWKGIPRSSFNETYDIIDYPDCPDVKDFIDPNWEERERNIVINYLEAGEEKKAWCGCSTCRICGKWNNGSTCLTDGKWIWPEGLSHYLREHHVKPPQEFVDYVLKKS